MSFEGTRRHGSAERHPREVGTREWYAIVTHDIRDALRGVAKAAPDGTLDMQKVADAVRGALSREGVSADEEKGFSCIPTAQGIEVTFTARGKEYSVTYPIRPPTLH